MCPGIKRHIFLLQNWHLLNGVIKYRFERFLYWSNFFSCKQLKSINDSAVWHFYCSIARFCPPIRSSTLLFALLFIFVCDTNWINELPKAKSQSIFICVTGFYGGSMKRAFFFQHQFLSKSHCFDSQMSA